SCPTSTRIAIAPVVPMRISPAVVGEERSGRVSVPFLGLPRPALIEIPSLAILSPYGLRRTLVLSKFTSGISRNDARDGSRVLPVAFFIAFPLNGRASRADDADRSSDCSMQTTSRP